VRRDSAVAAGPMLARRSIPRLRNAGLLAIVVALAGVAGACTPEQLAANPLGPCGDDARAAGGFPELEARVPRALGEDARTPDRVDSGRNCSDATLGTLKSHGVTEMRFAGATWNGTGSSSEGTVVAVLATPDWVPPLEAAWVEEFYESGARSGRKTDNIEVNRRTIESVGDVFWLDVLNDLSFQSVVTWQAEGQTHVVIVATDVAPLKDRATHNAAVADAIYAAAGVPRPTTPGCGCTRAPTPAARAS
jgi:hypothetical protein